MGNVKADALRARSPFVTGTEIARYTKLRLSTNDCRVQVSVSGPRLFVK